MLAISKLFYVAASLPPNTDILKIESRALQLLLRGPWNAIPSGVLKHAEALGLPSQARDLSLMSQASRVRVASSTSKNVIDAYDRCTLHLNTSFDIVLGHLDKHFLYDSCLHHIVFQYRRFAQEFGDLDVERIPQALAYKKCLRGSHHLLFCRFLGDRLNRFFDHMTLRQYMPKVIAEYRRSTSVLGFAPALTHLRAVANHWCTFSRFGVKRHSCLFGCGADRDIWEILCGICGLHNPGFDLASILLFKSDWVAVSVDHRNFILLGIHICFLVYNSCRHGQRISRRLVLHRLCGYTRSHPKAAKFVRRVRAFWLRVVGELYSICDSACLFDFLLATLSYAALSVCSLDLVPITQDADTGIHSLMDRMHWNFLLDSFCLIRVESSCCWIAIDWHSSPNCLCLSFCLTVGIR